MVSVTTPINLSKKKLGCENILFLDRRNKSIHQILVHEDLKIINRIKLSATICEWVNNGSFFDSEIKNQSKQLVRRDF